MTGTTILLTLTKGIMTMKSTVNEKFTLLGISYRQNVNFKRG